ncbi:hypothetical protein BH20ACI1_BH20ACI1_06750 [soil metagenome]
MSVKNHKNSSKNKILLAEDDDSMRRFVEVILQKANYDVIATEDGLAAMKAAIENEIDAIVADAVMPNMTGYDLCRMLRQNPDKKHIPFIILSGLNQNGAMEKENCLADAYLLKDENMTAEITKTLSNLLEGKAKS